MMDDVVGGRLANDPQESIPPSGARAEVAVRRQVLHERGRTGSGDVAGNRIDLLELSEVSGGFSPIKHEPIGIAAAPVDFVGIDGQMLLKLCRKSPWFVLLFAALDGTTLPHPRAPSTIEDGHPFVSRILQHPPETRRHAAGGIIIDDDLHARPDAPATESFFHLARRRKWVSPRFAGENLAGQVLLHVRVDGTRNVASEIILTPAIPVIQHKSTIDDHPVVSVEMPLQVVCRDQAGESHTKSTYVYSGCQ